MCTNSTYNVHQMNRNGHGYVYKNQKYNESRFANITKKKQKSNREFESRFHQFSLVYLYKNYIFRYILLAHSCQRRYIDRRQKFLFFSIAQRSI